MHNTTTTNSLVIELDHLMLNATDDLVLLELRRIKRSLMPSDWTDLVQSFDYIKKPALRLVELGYANFKENVEIVYSHYKDLVEDGAAEVDRRRIMNRFRELLADPDLTYEMKVLVEYIKRGLLKVADETDPIEVRFRSLTQRLAIAANGDDVKGISKELEELRPYLTDYRPY